MSHKSSKRGPKKQTQLEIPFGDQYHARIQSEFEKKALRPPKPPPDPALVENMRMTRFVYQDIEYKSRDERNELGWLLLSQTHDYTITCSVLDIAAAKNSAVYQPNIAFLNSVLKGRNDEFVGIAHSHPKGHEYLSTQDQRAAWSNLTSPDNPHLNAFLMPIIQTIPDTGRFEIIPFIVTCHPEGNGRVEVCRVELEIID
jgi:hypothetical protein